jgi:hypothetical protein
MKRGAVIFFAFLAGLITFLPLHAHIPATADARWLGFSSSVVKMKSVPSGKILQN